MAVDSLIPSELISFMGSLSEPHILCDRDYRILAANDAYRAKWEGQQNIVGRTCYEVSHRYAVPCDQAGESCPLQLSLRSGQRERVVHLHHTPRMANISKISSCHRFAMLRKVKSPISSRKSTRCLLPVPMSMRVAWLVVRRHSWT